MTAQPLALPFGDIPALLWEGRPPGSGCMSTARGAARRRGRALPPRPAPPGPRCWPWTCRSTAPAGGARSPWSPGPWCPSSGPCWTMPKPVGDRRPPVHQPGSLVLPAGLRGGAAGKGALCLPGTGYGGPDRGHDGLGRSGRGPAQGPGGGPHRLRGDPVLAVSPVCPRPQGPGVAHPYRPAPGPGRRPGPGGDGPGVPPPLWRDPDGGAGGGALVPHPGAAGGPAPLGGRPRSARLYI